MAKGAQSFVEAALSALERSLEAHSGDLRNVQLATVTPKGRPSLRTVVLRGFERRAATAEIHSDARGSKVRDIAGATRVALLAWSAEEHLQLRFEGSATLHIGDDLARGRWDKLSSNARKPYGMRADPGTPIGDPADQPHLPPDQQAKRFAVILVSLDTVDVLRLEPEGDQTRAEGRFTPGGLGARWIGA